MTFALIYVALYLQRIHLYKEGETEEEDTNIFVDLCSTSDEDKRFYLS